MQWSCSRRYTFLVWTENILPDVAINSCDARVFKLYNYAAVGLKLCFPYLHYYSGHLHMTMLGAMQVSHSIHWWDGCYIACFPLGVSRWGLSQLDDTGEVGAGNGRGYGPSSSSREDQGRCHHGTHCQGLTLHL